MAHPFLSHHDRHAVDPVIKRAGGGDAGGIRRAAGHQFHQRHQMRRVHRMRHKNTAGVAGPGLDVAGHQRRGRRGDDGIRSQRGFDLRHDLLFDRDAVGTTFLHQVGLCTGHGNVLRDMQHLKWGGCGDFVQLRQIVPRGRDEGGQAVQCLPGRIADRHPQPLGQEQRGPAGPDQAGTDDGDMADHAVWLSRVGKGQSTARISLRSSTCSTARNSCPRLRTCPSMPMTA